MHVCTATCFDLLRTQFRPFVNNSSVFNEIFEKIKTEPISGCIIRDPLSRESFRARIKTVFTRNTLVLTRTRLLLNHAVKKPDKIAMVFRLKRTPTFLIYLVNGLPPAR